MQEVAAQRKPSLAIGSRFSGFEPESERAVCKPEVQETEAIRRIKDAYRRYDFEINKDPVIQYHAIVQSIKGLRYSAKDVECFGLLLTEFQQDSDFKSKAGPFLSALINCGEDSEYTIHTQHLAEPLDNIGFMNEKDISIDGNAGKRLAQWMKRGSIVVKGDVGMCMGEHMEGGSIVVRGDAEDYVGSIKGGSITIEGDVGTYCGIWMDGGSITVKGHAGKGIGRHMAGGEIRLEGDFESLSDRIPGGKIYHRGRMIYPYEYQGRLFYPLP